MDDVPDKLTLGGDIAGRRNHDLEDYGPVRHAPLRSDDA
jgi:hypothetical protein